MLKKRQIIPIFALVSANLLLFANSALAAPDGSLLRAGLDTAANDKASGLKNQTTLVSAIGFLLSNALLFLSIIFLILTVYAGIRWMTAQGDEGTTKKARQTIVQAAIGMFICLMSYSIVNYIINSIQIKEAQVIVQPAATQAELEGPPAPPGL